MKFTRTISTSIAFLVCAAAMITRASPVPATKNPHAAAAAENDKGPHQHSHATGSHSQLEDENEEEEAAARSRRQGVYVPSGQERPRLARQGAHHDLHLNSMANAAAHHE